MNEAALIIGGIPFYDTLSDIEGSPYWVDLWASVNGYKIGLQIKPNSYKSASMAIYTGKSRTSQEKGHKLFQQKYGGKVFIIVPKEGKVDAITEQKIIDEYNRLLSMPKGKHE